MKNPNPRTGSIRYAKDTTNCWNHLIGQIAYEREVRQEVGGDETIDRHHDLMHDALRRFINPEDGDIW